MRIWFLLFGLGLGSLPACQSGPAALNDKSVLMHNDFEQSPGWGGAIPTLSATEAHSGRWSISTTPDQPYSYTFARALSDLSPTPLHKLRLEAYALRPKNGSNAQLIVQVDASPTDETKVLYASLPLARDVPTTGTWKAVSLPITLPATASGANILKIYLWNDQATAPTYLDDVVLRREE